MMIGIHSKVVFFSFAATKLKKRIEKENLNYQYGAKSAGAETIVHTFQQIVQQNESVL